MILACHLELPNFAIGIGASLLTVFLIYFFKQLSIFFIMIGYKGFYSEREQNRDNIKQFGEYKLDSYFKVRYPVLSNFFSWHNFLIIRQESQRGDWKSKIKFSSGYINEGTGLFDYLDEDRKRWGVHRIIMNKKSKLIHIKAIAKHVEKNPTDEYSIEKRTRKVKTDYDLKYPKDDKKG